jgi:hypothetical protein
MYRFAVPATLLTLVLGASLTSCGATRSPDAASPEANVAHATKPRDPNRTTDHPKPPSRTPSPAAPHRCRAGKMRLAVAFSGSAMSQPFADISITNTATRACLLMGYPRIALEGLPGLRSEGDRWP